MAHEPHCIYIHDLPETTSKKYGYADDLTILATDKQWTNIEKDLQQWYGPSAYFRSWRLKLSEGLGKKVLAAST